LPYAVDPVLALRGNAVDILRAMAILIEYPFLAVLPAGLLFYFYWLVKSRVVLTSAIIWLAYLFYEYAMKFRLLCTGECNIRVDLLAIYPFLIIVSLIGLIIFAVRRRKNAQAFR
jgi:hypothetical protein